MNIEKLEQVAKSLVAEGKGILAADESSPTANNRFEAVGVPTTEENRRLYRQLLLTVPNIGQYLTGVILYDETFWQSTDDNQLFRDYLTSQGVMTGIKVDQGLVDLPGFKLEKISRGLDTLPERIAHYAKSGAQFAKWRSVITIGGNIPTDECITANSFVLARYARICQEEGVVPIVEPEVLLDGGHTIDRCAEVMAHTFDTLFDEMKKYRVHLPGAVLKTSMVLPGNQSGQMIDHDKTTALTSEVLLQHVPDELGGVVFLSGGQTPRDAMINLNRIVKKRKYPWGLTFSYSRALQDPVLKAWAAKEDNATGVFETQLQYASAARDGKLDEGKLTAGRYVSRSQDL